MKTNTAILESLTMIENNNCETNIVERKVIIFYVCKKYHLTEEKTIQVFNTVMEQFTILA